MLSTAARLGRRAPALLRAPATTIAVDPTFAPETLLSAAAVARLGLRAPVRRVATDPTAAKPATATTTAKPATDPTAAKPATSTKIQMMESKLSEIASSHGTTLDDLYRELRDIDKSAAELKKEEADHAIHVAHRKNEVGRRTLEVAVVASLFFLIAVRMVF